MIRLAQESDIRQMLEIYTPYVERSTCSFEYEAPTEEAFLSRFRHITQQFPWLVWEEDGNVLGYTYASAPFARDAYRWCAEPSIYLAQSVRGRGIGRRLYEALEKILTLQGYRVLYAIITGENDASLAFHKAVGYMHLATFPDCGYKFGRWLGITWMEKRLNSVEFPSSTPINYNLIVKDDRNLHKILDNLSLS